MDRKKMVNRFKQIMDEGATQPEAEAESHDPQRSVFVVPAEGSVSPGQCVKECAEVTPGFVAGLLGMDTPEEGPVAIQIGSTPKLYNEQHCCLMCDPQGKAKGKPVNSNIEAIAKNPDGAKFYGDVVVVHLSALPTDLQMAIGLKMIGGLFSGLADTLGGDK